MSNFFFFLSYLYRILAVIQFILSIETALTTNDKEEFKRACRGVYLPLLRPVWLARKLYDKNKTFKL